MQSEKQTYKDNLFVVLIPGGKVLKLAKNIQKKISSYFDIYKKGSFKLNLPEIKENSVAIVPNSKVKKHNSGNNINQMYLDIIGYLLEQDKNIYIFRHSFEDLDFCREIYSLRNDFRMHILENNFNAIELFNLLSEFDYLIGSRYHSVVHAYKNNVPAFVIGWAVKYQELTEVFGQRQYCFDIRNNINFDKLINKLDKLNANYIDDKIKIEETLKIICQNNVFDAIKYK